MHVIDLYKFSVALANERTFEKFKVHGPYHPDSTQHEFWLTIFDKAMAKQ